MRKSVDTLDVPGAFASALRSTSSSSGSAAEQRSGRRMQDALRSYGAVAALVDREVMAWDALPEAQQHAMDGVISELNALASDGDGGDAATEAQFVLGVLYQEGRGMAKPKLGRAAELYQSATEAGRLEALYNLAGLTASGYDYTLPDPSLAFCMYEVAAQKGHVNAMFNLAVMYANGEGVDADETTGAEWFRRAASKGHPKAEAHALVLERRSMLWIAAVGVTTVAGGILISWALSGLVVGSYQAVLDALWPGSRVPGGEGEPYDNSGSSATSDAAARITEYAAPGTSGGSYLATSATATLRSSTDDD